MDFTIIVRHGETAFNRPPERFRGWTDVPLSDKGKEYVAKVAEDFSGLPVSSIHTDYLKRCVETADIIQSVLGEMGPEPLIIRDSGLLSWDIGELAGTKVSEDLDTYIQYMRHPKESVPGGESYGEFESRTLKNMEKILNKGIIAITHTGNIQLIKAWIDSDYKIPVPVDLVIDYGPENGEKPGDYIVIVKDKDDKPTIGTLGQAVKHEHEEVFGKL